MTELVSAATVSRSDSADDGGLQESSSCISAMLSDSESRTGSSLPRMTSSSEDAETTAKKRAALCRKSSSSSAESKASVPSTTADELVSIWKKTHLDLGSSDEVKAVAAFNAEVCRSAAKGLAVDSALNVMISTVLTSFFEDTRKRSDGIDHSKVHSLLDVCLACVLDQLEASAKPNKCNLGTLVVSCLHVYATFLQLDELEKIPDYLEARLEQLTTLFARFDANSKLLFIKFCSEFVRRIPATRSGMIGRFLVIVSQLIELDHHSSVNFNGRVHEGSYQKVAELTKEQLPKDSSQWAIAQKLYKAVCDLRFVLSNDSSQMTASKATEALGTDSVSDWLQSLKQQFAVVLQHFESTRVSTAKASAVGCKHYTAPTAFGALVEDAFFRRTLLTQMAAFLNAMVVQSAVGGSKHFVAWLPPDSSEYQWARDTLKRVFSLLSVLGSPDYVQLLRYCIGFDDRHWSSWKWRDASKRCRKRAIPEDVEIDEDMAQRLSTSGCADIECVDGDAIADYTDSFTRLMSEPPSKRTKLVDDYASHFGQSEAARLSGSNCASMGHSALASLWSECPRLFAEDISADYKFLERAAIEQRGFVQKKIDGLLKDYKENADWGYDSLLAKDARYEFETLRLLRDLNGAYFEEAFETPTYVKSDVTIRTDYMESLMRKRFPDENFDIFDKAEAQRREAQQKASQRKVRSKAKGRAPAKRKAPEPLTKRKTATDSSSTAGKSRKVEVVIESRKERVADVVSLRNSVDMSEEARKAKRRARFALPSATDASSAPIPQREEVAASRRSRSGGSKSKEAPSASGSSSAIASGSDLRNAASDSRGPAPEIRRQKADEYRERGRYQQERGRRKERDRRHQRRRRN